MIIDIHGHWGNINQAPFWAADETRLDRMLADAGVDLLCVSAAKSIMYDACEGNAGLDVALARAARLRGYVAVNPVFPESAADLELLETNRMFVGVKIHPDYHGYDLASRAVQPFLDDVAERVPLVLSHVSCMPGTGFAAAAKVLDLAARHPRTNFILAHMAGIYQNGLYPYFPNFEGLEEVAERALGNVYVDTAHFLMYVYPGVMERMVELIGCDQIVFGTDMPLQGAPQARFALETIRALPIAEAEKQQILGGTAARLIGEDRERR